MGARRGQGWPGTTVLKASTGQAPQGHPAPPRISHNYGNPIIGRNNTSPSLTCSRSEGTSDASSSSRSLQCPQEGQELWQGSTVHLALFLMGR